MKKLLFILIALMAVQSASASNYFSMRKDNIQPVNDTLSFYPDFASLKYQLFMMGHFDGYLDHWYLVMNHPGNVPLVVDDNHTIEEGPAMSLLYENAQGVQDTCHAALLTNLPNQTIGGNTGDYISYLSSTIYTMGYWDPDSDGVYQSYGTVKWPDGDHDYLFSFWLTIPYGIIDFDLTLDLYLSSTYDLRDVTCISNHSARTFHIHAGYKPGDVNGNGTIDVADVTMAQDMVFSTEGAGPYQVDAADVNRDGNVTISDVTAIIDLMLL